MLSIGEFLVTTTKPTKRNPRMSHFSVLVIHAPTTNIEDILQPFHEFECTDDDDQYIQNIDITAEVQADINEQGSLEKGLEWRGYDTRTVATEEEANLGTTHKYGYAIVQDGKLIKAVERTNPNAKWDWYQVGGRFSGKLLTRAGIATDEAPLSAVDFVAMEQRAADRAAARYDRAQTFLQHAPRPTPWKDILAAHDNNVEQARRAYREQPAVQAARKDDKDLLWADADELQAFYDPREEFINKARKSAFCPFAIIRNGKWYERGEMGWWACVSDEKESQTWQQEVQQLLQDLPPSTLLTVVDCHI